MSKDEEILEGIVASAERIDETHQAIHAVQAQLQGQLDALAARWHGPGARQFQQAYASFDSEFEHVKQGLDRVHSQLAAQYRTGEVTSQRAGTP